MLHSFSETVLSSIYLLPLCSKLPTDLGTPNASLSVVTQRFEKMNGTMVAEAKMHLLAIQQKRIATKPSK
ncbi:hypothetical protein V2J09_011941 [Rumex salicifolius]